VSVRSAQRDDTHARVVAAANAQFLEHGFTDTTIRDIATAAGVSTGTVMIVGDKRALLVKVFDGLIAEEGPPEQLFSNPENPRTRQFLSSILEASPGRHKIPLQEEAEPDMIFLDNANRVYKTPPGARPH